METFKTVNSVPTKVVTFGKTVEDDLSNVKYLVLIFPGNPGVIAYYREFMKEIYDRLQAQYPESDIPVWGISHAGHQVDNVDSCRFPTLEGNPDLYSLEGQCEHKTSFIKTFIPNHIKIIGVGHSIGCKLWLETIKTMTLEGSSCPDVHKCFMLFPTIERMRDTPNGRRFTSLMPYQSLIESFLWPFTFLPTVFHKLFLRLYFFSENDIPTSVVEGSLQLFNFHVLRRVITMARCEMEQVFDLDVTALKSHLNNLFFYFGTTDDWCPLSLVDEMKITLPEMSFKICENGFSHAFVVKSSLEMAAIVSDLITIPHN